MSPSTTSHTGRIVSTFLAGMWTEMGKRVRITCSSRSADRANGRMSWRRTTSATHVSKSSDGRRTNRLHSVLACQSAFCLYLGNHSRTENCFGRERRPRSAPGVVWCKRVRVHQQSRPDTATRHRGAGMRVARSSCPSIAPTTMALMGYRASRTIGNIRGHHAVTITRAFSAPEQPLPSRQNCAKRW